MEIVGRRPHAEAVEHGRGLRQRAERDYNPRRDDLSRLAWMVRPAGCAAAMAASATPSGGALPPARAAMARAAGVTLRPDSTTSPRPSRRTIGRWPRRPRDREDPPPRKACSWRST